MPRCTVLGVALAATIAIGACSAATATPAAAPSAAPAVAAPSVAAASPSPTVDAPSVAPQSLAPAAASGSQSIHVLEVSLSWADVRVGSLSKCTAATCLGDYVVGHSSLRDATTNKTVGTLVTECFVVDAASGRYHCPATTITLTGRGQLVFTENALLGPHWCPGCGFAPEPGGYTVDYPVIGGTGEFLGARGEVTSPAGSTYPDGDWVITLTK